MGMRTRATELRYTEIVTGEDGDWTPRRPWDRGPVEGDHEGDRDGGRGTRTDRGRSGGAAADVSRLTRKELGRLGEDLAASYLKGEGYEILVRNYRCREGEADLVALDPERDYAVLVEVKTRRAGTVSDGTYPEEAVDAKKRRRYRRIAACFLMDYYPTPAIRFDVVGVVVAGDGTARFEHVVGAFGWDAER